MWCVDTGNRVCGNMSALLLKWRKYVLHESAGPECVVITEGDAGSDHEDVSDNPAPTVDAVEACNFGE